MDVSPDPASAFPPGLLQLTSLTVVVSTCRRPHGLRRLLAALAPQVAGWPERKIVVVNDGSHDAAYAAVAKEFSHIMGYQALPENVGVAAARNQSVHLADADFVVFTDDDCVPPPFWLDWLAARLAASPDLDVVAGGVRPLIPEQPGFFTRVQARHGIYPTPGKTHGELRFVTANLAIRRSLFWNLGGFRVFEDFPGAGEDTELSARVARSDCRRCLDLSWFVEHDVGDGFARNVCRYYRYGFANMHLAKSNLRMRSQDHLASYRVDRALAHFRNQFRTQLAQARGASRWQAVQWISAFLASLVYFAYFCGAVQAGRAISKRAC